MVVPDVGRKRWYIWYLKHGTGARRGEVSRGGERMVLYVFRAGRLFFNVFVDRIVQNHRVIVSEGEDWEVCAFCVCACVCFPLLSRPVAFFSLPAALISPLVRRGEQL